MSQDKKLKLCKNTVQELLDYDVPSTRIVPLMNQIYGFLKMGDGLVWSQIEEIIETTVNERMGRA